MCGIAGIITAPNVTIADMQERLMAMARAMQHRGPDDEGTYISPDGCVGLANRRLAIRDLSPAGHMPMSNDEKSIWITYNGEIYNADTLRSELEAQGQVFRSTSDTEVILKGYQVWGEAVLSRLEGMFAFAIYDRREVPCVLLARDQMGIKPLYYAFNSQTLIFASELKTVLASGLISHEMNHESLIAYLQLGSIPNPLTIYRDISALEPASSFVVLPEHWIPPQVNTYWCLPTDLDTAPQSYEQVVEKVERLLEQAVRNRLVSDVPLGAFLSGGLDSSALVGFMRRVTTSTIRTCSMVFEESEYSEARYAKLMAESVGAEHFERVITADDMLHELDNILGAMDQPSVDGVNTYFVSQTAHQAGLTVALSGLGGDELFGGYPNTFGQIPKIHRLLQTAQAIPFASTIAQQITANVGRPGWGRLSDAFSEKASLAGAYLTRRSLFSRDEVRRLVAPEVWNKQQTTFNATSYIQKQVPVSQFSDDFAWISRAELRTYTHNQLLRDTDVMSMKHSLEVRVPFFDTALVEMVLRLPAYYKLKNNERPKPLLSQAMKSVVPTEIAKRKDKQGFTFPFDTWLRTKLHKPIRELLHQTIDSKVLQPSTVMQLFDDFQDRKVHWSRLWGIVIISEPKI